MGENAGRLLVADDDRAFRALVVEYFLELGYAVDTATDGLEAVRMASENDYDLIVMDVSMPRFNGIEAIRTVRREKPEQKILIVTAFLAGEVAEQIAAAGASRAIQKPIELSELQETIATLIG